MPDDETTKNLFAYLTDAAYAAGAGLVAIIWRMNRRMTITESDIEQLKRGERDIIKRLDQHNAQIAETHDAVIKLNENSIEWDRRSREGDRKLSEILEIVRRDKK